MRVPPGSIVVVAAGSEEERGAALRAMLLAAPYHFGGISVSDSAAIREMLSELTVPHLVHPCTDAAVRSVTHLPLLLREARGPWWLILDGLALQPVREVCENPRISFRAFLAPHARDIPDWVTPTHAFGPGTARRFPLAERVAPPPRTHHFFGHPLLFDPEVTRRALDSP